MAFEDALGTDDVVDSGLEPPDLNPPARTQIRTLIHLLKFTDDLDVRVHFGVRIPSSNSLRSSDQ